MALFKRKADPAPVADSVARYADGFHADAPSLRAGDLTVGEYANGIPNIKIGSLIRGMLKQLPVIGILTAIGAVPIWMFSQDFKREYSGEGTIMVQLGDEYVYQPVSGTTNNASLLQTPDTITLNEVAIIKNPEVMDRVLGEIMSRPGGLVRFAPDTAPKLQRDPGSLDYQLAYMELRKQMDKQFFVGARPKSSIIDLSYKHEDPKLAVSTLNALMDAYMSYRRTVFVEGAGDLIAQRRMDTETQLKQVDRQIASFLERNKISDFDSEQKGAAKRTEDLKASLNTERARIAETERALAVVEDQLRGMPAEIDLYVDDRASNRIAQAELELQQLLAKYLPTSDPVRQKRVEIAELRSLQSSNGGRATGGRRVGPNPTHQALLTRRNTLQATANAAREKEFTLQRQLDSVDGKLARLTKLSPTFNDLLRERDTLTNRLKTYLTKEQEALINQSQAEANAENVKVISSATYPIKGRDMRKLVFAIGVLAWGMTLFLFGLFRIFSDPRHYATPPGARRGLGGVAPVMPEVAMPATEPQFDPIPEPVQPYAPAAPLPGEYAPAAASWDAPAQPAQSWDAQPWDAQPWDAQPYAEPQVAPIYADGQPAYHDPNAYAQPGYDAGHDPNAYAQPATELAVVQADNPYAAGASAAPLDPPAYS